MSGARMDLGEDASLDARNRVVGERVHALVEQAERQRRELAAARARVAELTGAAWSSDRLVRVVVNAAGVPVEVQLAATAYRHAPREKLGRSVVEAAQAAAREVARRVAAEFAPITAQSGDAPDLSDLVPGATDIGDLFGAPPTAPKPRLMTEEEEDEYYRSGGYLREGR
ncbi:YbaB/EbfC family nucleoid-associated protein [Nocardia panacis]|uniref:YbaB/EbfC family nucleoid-associated protein n=1 Tax=Nocardia panacis TaxID=2340916 RepID=UPI001315ADBC|nr:YbaB/EbfC family nucleoid-associated protein [Nocardia panacis]